MSDSADTSLLYNPGFVVLSLSRPQVAQMIYRDPAMVADARGKTEDPMWGHQFRKNEFNFEV